MMPPIETKNIEILLRKVLIQNSRVRETRILNALSARGIDLSDIINDTIYDSYSMSDVFILFELIKSLDGDNYITEKNDDYMLSINTYTFHIMIYGNKSEECSQYIKSAFKQEEIVSELRDKGIFIRGVSTGESINEFINNSLWRRTDLNITLTTTFEIEKIIKSKYFSENKEENSISNIIVKTI